MNTRQTSKLLAASLLLCAASQSYAQTLFLTGRGDTIRTSSDGGATWSTFATVTGGQLRGLEVGNVGGSNYVFVNNVNGDATVRPLLAYNASATQVASTTYNGSGAFNEQPIGYFNGNVYVSTGGTPQNVFASFNGSAFGTVANSNVGSWQGNNITFASSGGTDYIFTSGAGGTGIRRSDLTVSGAAGTFTGVTTSGGPSNLMDIAFTPSGRLLTIGSNGIFLSGAGSVTTNAISLSSAFTFSATETLGTGDMGANARDFSLIGSTLYAVSNTNIYRYSLDDTNGTISFLGGSSHGFSNAGVQIAGISAIPEPSSFAALAGLGALGLVGLRRRRRA